MKKERLFDCEQPLSYVWDLQLHCQTTQTFIRIVHCQGVLLLPLFPMAHQNEREAYSDAVIWNSFKQGAVCLITVKLRYIHVARLPVVGLVVQ